MRGSLLHGIARRVLSYQSVWGAGLDTSSSSYDGWGPGTLAGVKVTQDSALRLDAVYGCVRLLADSVAQLPLDTFRRVSEGRREPYPLPIWLEFPNSELTRYELFERMMASLLLDGNAYVYVNRQANGDIVELIPLHPGQVRVERDRATRRLMFHVQDDAGDRFTVPFTEMLHVRGFTVGGPVGLSPIAYARQTIGRGVAAEKFQSQWLGDGAIPSSILSTDQQMSREQAQRNQEEWIASHAGRRRPAFLSGGLKWAAITLSPDDAQALETEKWTVQKIARLYRVPPHMIGDLERATFSNIEHQAIDFVTHTLNPWLVRIEQAMRWLLPFGVYPRFNVAGLLRGDTLARYQAYAQARTAGWLNVDEIRELEDRPPVVGGAGKDYLQPMNMVPLGTPVADKTVIPATRSSE